jgi:hypothetical protein
MKRLTKALSELIDAFLAEHASRLSTAQLEKDFLISEVFSVFTDPVLHQSIRPHLSCVADPASAAQRNRQADGVVAEAPIF